MGEMFVVVDNRLVQAKQAITSCDFAIQSGFSNLANLMAMVLSRLLVYSSEHRLWVPQPVIYSSRNATEVQEVRHSSINEAVACISTDLKPMNTFDGDDVESGPASTWKYINSGLRNVHDCLKIKKNPVREKVLIFIFTNDCALFHTVTLPMPLNPSHDVFTSSHAPMHEQITEFKMLLTQIRSQVGEKTIVELRMVVAKLEGLPGRGVGSDPYMQSGERTMREVEVYELGKMLAKFDAESKSSKFSGSDQVHSRPLDHQNEGGMSSVHVVAPTSLVYEDVLRSMLVSLAPCVTSVLSFPTIQGITCDLNVQITAPTMCGADELAATRTGLNKDGIRILQLLPHTAVPAMCLEGAVFQLSAAPISFYQEPRELSAYEHNLLAFTALETALRARSTILIVRILKEPRAPHIVPAKTRFQSQGRLSATYWALLPPPQSSTPGQEQQFSMVRLVDREHFLLEGVRYETDITLPVAHPGTTNGVTKRSHELDEAALRQNLQTVESYLGELSACSHGHITTHGLANDADVSLLHCRGLQELHGDTPAHSMRALYNPLSYPGGEIACQISAVEWYWHEQAKGTPSIPLASLQGHSQVARSSAEEIYNRKRIAEKAVATDFPVSAQVKTPPQEDVGSEVDVNLFSSSDETIFKKRRNIRKRCTGTTRRRKDDHGEAGSYTAGREDGIGKAAQARHHSDSRAATTRTQRNIKGTTKKRRMTCGDSKVKGRLSKKTLNLVGKYEDKLTDSLESVTDSGGDFWS